MVLNYILVGCPCVYYDKIFKHWLESWVWLASHVTLWIIIIIIMNFIQVSCLVAQAQCLTNWGDCGLLYNAYLKNLQPFTRKGQRFFFFTLSTLSYLIPILRWHLIWGSILPTDSPLFRTSFSKAFYCSCAFFEYAFQIIM